MARLLRGFFGTTERYALMDLQIILPGPVTGDQIIGQQAVGGCTLTTPAFGTRQQ
jgi:hypothetical protein